MELRTLKDLGFRIDDIQGTKKEKESYFMGYVDFANELRAEAVKHAKEYLSNDDYSGAGAIMYFFNLTEEDLGENLDEENITGSPYPVTGEKEK